MDDGQSPRRDRPDLRRHPREARGIHVLPAEVVPMTAADYDQAVTALAAMIAVWWNDNRIDL
jgi:hypothetical protein